MQLLASSPSGDDKPTLLENLQVLHHPKPRHGDVALERTKRLPILIKQLI